MQNCSETFHLITFAKEDCTESSLKQTCSWIKHQTGLKWYNKTPKYELNIKAACQESDALNQVCEWINVIIRMKKESVWFVNQIISESNNKSDMQLSMIMNVKWISAAYEPKRKSIKARRNWFWSTLRIKITQSQITHRTNHRKKKWSELSWIMKSMSKHFSDFIIFFGAVVLKSVPLILKPFLPM